MLQTLPVLAVFGFLGTLSPHANAQGVVMQRNVSLEIAQMIAEATLTECESRGFNTAVADLLR